MIPPIGGGKMPWKESCVMSLRKEFVELVKSQSGTVSKLCRNFNISRKTGYKWLARYFREGDAGLEDRSRRPLYFPNKSNPEIEKTIVSVRQQHPVWGARKIKRYLETFGECKLPPVSTVNSMLQRNGLLKAKESQKQKQFVSFQRESPNDLWQMDFKGHVPARNGRCNPLTVLDDYSRYSILLQACADQRSETVKKSLISAFRKYGLPRQILVDNGAPWGDDLYDRQTRLTVWLMRLGIHVLHSRPRHPQTLGKEERFHRTLKAELLGLFLPWDLEECQRRFDQWRLIYNHKRPHQSLQMEVPASRYQISDRIYPEQLPELQFGPDDIVRKVFNGASIYFQKRILKISKAFIGEQVALRAQKDSDGVYDVFFANHWIRTIDLKQHPIRR
jgi:transposase InsO family protein